MKKTPTFLQNNEARLQLLPFIAMGNDPINERGAAIFFQAEVSTEENTVGQHWKNPNTKIMEYPVVQVSTAKEEMTLRPTWFGKSTGLIFYDLPKEQETRDEKTRDLSSRLIRLFKTLGKRLFSKLSYDQKMLMINTFGVVDLGPNINIRGMYKSIEG